MKYVMYILMAVMLTLSACGSGEKQPSRSVGIEIPESDKKAGLVDAVVHYWDRIDFADSTWNDREYTLKAEFGRWAELSLALYYEYGEAKSDVLIERVKVNTMLLIMFMDMADECFRNPNSPYRCEELYIPMLEEALQSNVGEEYKYIYQSHLAKALMNRQGTTASNFAYTTATGINGTLHGIKSKFTLLYFFNPGCHDCARVSRLIAESPVLTNMASENELAVLALYPDEDITAWKEHEGENPSQWITARFSVQSERDKYDLPAIPNLYLLDENKMVVMKDATIEEIIFYLETLSDEGV